MTMIWRPRGWLRDYKNFAMVAIDLCGRLAGHGLDADLSYGEFEAQLQAALAASGVTRDQVERFAALGARREAMLARALDLVHAPAPLREAYLALERTILLAPDGVWQAIVAPQPPGTVLAAAEPPDSPYRRIHHPPGTA